MIGGEKNMISKPEKWWIYEYRNRKSKILLRLNLQHLIVVSHKYKLRVCNPLCCYLVVYNRYNQRYNAENTETKRSFVLLELTPNTL